MNTMSNDQIMELTWMRNACAASQGPWCFDLCDDGWHCVAREGCDHQQQQQHSYLSEVDQNTGAQASALRQG